MPIPQCLICRNLSAIPVPCSDSFSEFQDFGFALTTLWKQSRLFLRAGFQSQSVWDFTAIGDISRFETVPRTASSAPFRSKSLPLLPVPVHSRRTSAEIIHLLLRCPHSDPERASQRLCFLVAGTMR